MKKLLHLIRAMRLMLRQGYYKFNAHLTYYGTNNRKIQDGYLDRLREVYLERGIIDNRGQFISMDKMDRGRQLDVHNRLSDTDKPICK